MGDVRSMLLRVRAHGDLACFTRPELKAERMSYPVLTPSAARGLLEAILWKPAIKWHVERIRVLKPIRFTAFRRNEVNSKAPAPTAALVAKGGVPPVLFADEDRAQRNTVALRNVDYIIEARFSMTDKAGPEDNIRKFEEMFRRRVEGGQHFHQPYFGCREFPARIEPVDAIPEPHPELKGEKELGLMLWDIEFGPKRKIPRFFAARLNDGVLEVSDDPLATLAGASIGSGGGA